VGGTRDRLTVRIRLTTTGARTGETRATTLYAWEDGDDLIVVGSRGGSAQDPGWAHNLRAHPSAHVSTETLEWQATAEEIGDGTERDRVWAMVVKAFPSYAGFQRRTKRIIPLFRLRRSSGPGPASR
jgi:deazaflavin-dependent oxidoreductase (nitroreductase family)